MPAALSRSIIYKSLKSLIYILLLPYVLIMDSFLKKYSQLANKNTNIIITLGTRENDYVFDRNILPDTVHKIIAYLAEHYKIRKKYFTECIYNKNTDQIIHSNNVVTHSILHDTDMWCGENYLLVNRKFVTDNQTLPSHATYDNIRDTDVLEMLVDNSLICRFTVDGDCHNVSVIVNKPCAHEKISTMLDIISGFL